MNKVDLTINVPRTELISALETKISDLEIEAADRIRVIETERDGRSTVREQLAEYYIHVGRMLDEKRAVIAQIPTGGGSYGYRAVEEFMISLDPDADPLPEMPDKAMKGQETRAFNDQITSVKDALVRATSDIRATIKLLKLSTDELVPVKTADYEKMLGTTLKTRGYHY